ncbi:MAG: Gfo/Idh/MocA family protein [Candidatus Heimdallarchaeaceae archaeon]
MKLGIVGLGNWGKRVAEEAITLLEEGHLDDLYLCDLDSSILSEYENLKTTNNYDELLENVDCVHICTSNSNHYSLGKKALKKGVHALIEKPLTSNLVDAYNLIETSGECGCVIQVGHIFRFANSVRKLKEMYEANVFGEVIHVNVDWTHSMQPLDNTNVLWDLLPHPLDALHFVTSQWPIDVKGFSKGTNSNRIDEMAILQLNYQSYLTANIHISWINPIKRRRIEIIGSNKSAIVECVKQTIELYDKKGNVEQVEIEANNTIREELLNFIESVKSGKSFKNSAIIGLRTVDFIEKTISILVDSNGT